MRATVYKPRLRRNPTTLNVSSAWGDIPTILEDICNRFDVGIDKAIEFGVDHGYSTSALSSYFVQVVGVDTFEGDIHAGSREQDQYEITKQNLKNFQNVFLIKDNYKEFIKKVDVVFDLAHIDITHDYESTFECGEWAVQHARVTLFHDTESFPDVKRACNDLAEKYNLEFFNYESSNGLGILVNRKILKQSRKINVYVNAAIMSNVNEIFLQLIDRIKISGLYRACDRINVVANGNLNNFYIDLTDEKVSLFNPCDDVSKREFPTLDLLWENSQKNDGVTLYLHTKGVSHGENETIKDWTEYLTHFNVDQWMQRYDDLQTFDCAGVNLNGNHDNLNYPPTMWTAGHPPLHYSGNFWWTRNEHIRELPKPSEWIPPQGDSAPKQNYSLFNYTAEMWLCQLKDSKYHCAWSSDINHYHESYPKDRYYGKRLKTYDVFPFFNELDMLELRLKTLDEAVDVFVIVESPWTFSGKEKPLYFADNVKRFEKWYHKIRHVVLKKMPETESAWERESYTRDMMLEALKDANPNDVIFMSDCDEIWDPKKKYESFNESKITCYHMDLFYYHLNTKQLDAVWDIGTKRLRFKDWPGGQNLRKTHADTIIKNGGWHFSYAGDVEQIAYKINSFAHTEYANEKWTNRGALAQKIEAGEDIFDRGRKYTIVPIDETFPLPLQNEKERWSHLIKTHVKEKQVMEPTQDQLAQLKRNTKAMIDWINHMHDYLQDPLNEVYLKVGQNAEQDAAQAWISKVNGFAFDIIGKLPFPGAEKASSVLSALFSSYDTNSAPRLDQIFGSIWSRFSANFLRANDDLGYVFNDPVSHWNDMITNPIDNKQYPVNMLASADVVFPTQQDDINNFNAITDATVTSFRYNLTKYVLGQKWTILHQPNSTFWSNWNDNDAQNFAKQQINGNRDVFLTWWHDQNGSCAGCPNDGISTSEPRLGIGDWYSSWDYYHGDSAPRDLCDWLIQDDGFGTVFNPNAIATRHEVFYDWPINGNLSEHPDHTERKGNIKQPVSDEDRNRAKLWRAFMTSVPRKDVEQDIIQKTVDDPKFAYDLLKNPKKTLSDYIGLEIPDGVNVEVIQEMPGNYKLVLPYIGRPSKKIIE